MPAPTHTVERPSASPDETEALGLALGRVAPRGGILGLVGELGAGKTCLVRGLAAGLGADPEAVHSPTFVIATEYPGGRLPLHHVDLYRLDGPLADTEFLRDVVYGDGVAAVEWFERLQPEAGDEVLVATLRYAGDDRRTIRLDAYGPRHGQWLAAATDT